MEMKRNYNRSPGKAQLKNVVLRRLLPIDWRRQESSNKDDKVTTTRGEDASNHFPASTEHSKIVKQPEKASKGKEGVKRRAQDIAASHAFPRKKTKEMKTMKAKVTTNQEETEDDSGEQSTSSDEFQYDSSCNSSSVRETTSSGSSSSWNPKKKKKRRMTRRARATKALSSSIRKRVEPDSSQASERVRAGALRYCLRKLRKRPAFIDLSSGSEDEVSRRKGKRIKKAVQPKMSSGIKNTSFQSSEPPFAPLQIALQPTNQEPIDTYIESVLDEMGAALELFSLSVGDAESIPAIVPTDETSNSNEVSDEDDVVAWLDQLLQHELL